MQAQASGRTTYCSLVALRHEWTWVFYLFTLNPYFSFLRIYTIFQPEPLGGTWSSTVEVEGEGEARPATEIVFRGTRFESLTRRALNVPIEPVYGNPFSWFKTHTWVTLVSEFVSPHSLLPTQGAQCRAVCSQLIR